MSTAAVPRPTAAIEFALRATLWSLVGFGLLRLNWTATHLLLPLARAEGAAAVRLFGASATPVEVTLACSGAEALALCLGAVLAFPVTAWARASGAVGGAALILALNTLRIGILGRAAASSAWFNALHVYVWPAVLLVAIAGYLFTWMHRADGRASSVEHESARPTVRFVVIALGFLVIFIVVSPLYLQSRAVLALAGFAARTAAMLLGAVGVDAHTASNVLWTRNGGFLVTQECIATPLIPLYLAGICAYCATWRWRILGLAAAAPLFFALGVLRLLMVAFPASVATSPLFLVHAFFQLLLGGFSVFLAAFWRYRGRAGVGHALLGVVAGVMFVRLLGPQYTQAVSVAAAVPLEDPQGAIGFLPAFQVGLYLAVWIAAFAGAGWMRFLAGLAVLGVTQTAGLVALHLANNAGITAHVRDVRGWAVAGPLLVVAAVVNIARPHR